MASSPANEKPDGACLTVTTTQQRLINKQSHETFASDSLAPTAEKHDGQPRTSDVSTPSTARLNPFDTDIEAMITTTETSQRRELECTKGGTDCHVWPSQEHWKAKAKKAKAQRRNCNCFDHMSKRNRLIVKVLIGLLIVGIAVGVGVGVSKPLGAGIWQNHKK